MTYNNLSLAMMPYQCFTVIILAIICSSSDAYRFIVGGKDGWMLNPTETYNHWAERTRFSVNDTLYFKYNNSSDSVLVVSRDDYDNCKTDTPISQLLGGDSEFKFERSGPFYFISGIKQNCDQGQKLIIVVLAVRNRPTVLPSPGISPVPAPVNYSPTSGVPNMPPANSPTSGVPVMPPANSSPPSPELPDSPVPSSLTPPGSTTPGGANSTAPSGSSANVFNPSFAIISTAIFMSTVAFYRV